MRKKIFFILTLVFVFMLFSQSLFSKTITINHIPTNIDDFLEIRNSTAKTPEGGAAIMILALLVYCKATKKTFNQFFKSSNFDPVFPLFIQLITPLVKSFLNLTLKEK